MFNQRKTKFQTKMYKFELLFSLDLGHFFPFRIYDCATEKRLRNFEKDRSQQQNPLLRSTNFMSHLKSYIVFFSEV